MAVFVKEDIGFIERRIARPGVMHDVHFHNKYEIYYLEKGRVRYFVGSNIYLLEEGDMIFVPKNVFHKTDSSHSQNDVERILISFSDDFVLPETEKYMEELKRQSFIKFQGDMLYKIRDILQRIESEENNKTSGYEELIHLYFNQLLVLISRYRVKAEHSELNESYMIIQDAAKYISKNYNSDLSLVSLAKRFSMSPGHFSKQFKKMTGVGLNEYINISRIAAAEKLLMKNEISITEVSAECGFNDSNYFAAVFKKLKGVTPKKYSMKT